MVRNKEINNQAKTKNLSRTESMPMMPHTTIMKAENFVEINEIIQKKLKAQMDTHQGLIKRLSRV